MAATMHLFEITAGGDAYTPGSGGNDVAGSNLYFRSTNTASNTGTGTSDPVVKPAANSQNSYTKFLHPRASGSFATVGNTYVYCQTAGLATGVSLYFLTTNTNTYTTPTVKPYGDNSSNTVAAHLSTNDVDSSGAKSLHVVATGAITSAGDVGDFLVAWMEVDSTASAGAMGSVDIVIQWDET